MVVDSAALATDVVVVVAVAVEAADFCTAGFAAAVAEGGIGCCCHVKRSDFH